MCPGGLLKIPKIEEIEYFCRLKHPRVDAQTFFLHYQSNGWCVGKTKMKNWKAAVANWDRMRQLREEYESPAKSSCRMCMDSGTLLDGNVCKCPRGEEAKQARIVMDRIRSTREQGRLFA